MPTNQFSCTPAGWTKVTNGESAALIQLDTNGPVKVRKSITDPTAGDTVGIVMSRNTLGTISFDVLGGENLYIRSIDTDEERMNVIT